MKFKVFVCAVLAYLTYKRVRTDVKLYFAESLANNAYDLSLQTIAQVEDIRSDIFRLDNLVDG